ncbi:MAG: cytochrome P450, partial [Beijerinckiaceae bacterium]|nr:cytochrome P450 [Beijerinckiaceae bacterium]
MTTLEALAATAPEGLVESRRPVLSVLASLLRNPLQAMPPEVYRERLVLATTGGRTSLYVCD